MRGSVPLLVAVALVACSSPTPAAPSESPISSEEDAEATASASPSSASGSRNFLSYLITGDYRAEGMLVFVPEETHGSASDDTVYLSFFDGTAVASVSLWADGNGVSLGIGEDLVFRYFDPFYGDEYSFIVVGEDCAFDFTRNDASGVTATFDCRQPVAVTTDGQVTVTLSGSMDADLYQPPWPLVPGVSEFGDGVYEVGVDIEPGTYRIREPAEDCYWKRVSGFGGSHLDIIDGHRGAGFATVTIQDTDPGFESEGCGQWSGDLSAVIDPEGPISDDGVFIVGTDVAPGTWTSTASSDADVRCFVELLIGFGGNELEVSFRDFTESGGMTVTIEETDHGFSTEGCGTWTRAN
ncbi:MAG: hypothetical protein ACRDFZ_00030 [Candidatus Limnocylindria bacterium]